MKTHVWRRREKRRGEEKKRKEGFGPHLVKVKIQVMN